MNLRGKNRINAEFSMSSMTDIVFLLLIFFMLTSSMVMTRSIDLILPRSDSNAKMKQDPSSLSVSIKKNGQYYIDQDETSREKIERILKEKFRNVTEPHLIIRPEQGVPIEQVVEILDIANRNRYKTILATQPIR